MSKDIFEHHKEQIKKTNRKYPLIDYFLTDKPIDKCSDECQRQVKELLEEK